MITILDPIKDLPNSSKLSKRKNRPRHITEMDGTRMKTENIDNFWQLTISFWKIGKKEEKKKFSLCSANTFRQETQINVEVIIKK